MIQASPEQISQVDEVFFSGLVNLMGNRDESIYSPALTIVSQCFSLDAPGLIDIGLKLGVLDNYR